MSQVHELRQGQSRPADPQSPGEQSPPMELLFRTLHIVAKHKWMVLLTMIVVLAAGAGITSLQPKLYTASSTIVIHPRAPRILDKVQDLEDDTVGRSWGGLEQFYNTQQDILTGKAVAGNVVEELALDRDPDWVGPLTDPDTGEPRSPADLRRKAVTLLQESTTLTPSPKSQISTISVTNGDPQLAAQLATALAENYRDYVVQMRLDLTRESSSWLSEQVDTQRAELEASEEAIQAFVEANALESMTIAEWRNIRAERVAELTAALDVKERERVAAEAEADELARWIAEGKTYSTHPAIADDAVVRQLTAEIRELERRVTRNQETYLEKWPGKQADEDELVLLRSELAKEVERATGAVQIRHRQALREERVVREKIEVASAEALAMGSLEVEYNRLRRIADSNATLYEDVLRRAKETEIAQRMEASNINILEYAQAPKRPSHPNQMLSLLATILAALGFGLLSAFVLEGFDGTIRDPSELESFFKLRPLGVMPTVGESREGTVFADAGLHSAPAECLRSVRTNLLFMATKKSIRRVLVTSAGPKEGKTTLCTNIAATMALAGHRVLLVDTDMRRPRVHRMFGLDNEEGIVDILVGERTPEQVIKPAPIDGLDVLMCGPKPANPAEMLGSRAFDALLDRLSEKYDYVFMDSPPALLVSDARILGQKCDGTLLVLRVGKTERRHFREALRGLDSVHLDVLGVVCNGVDLHKPGYGYGRYGGYGYGYGYGSYGYGYGAGYGYGDDDDDRKRGPVPVSG